MPYINGKRVSNEEWRAYHSPGGATGWKEAFGWVDGDEPEPEPEAPAAPSPRKRSAGKKAAAEAAVAAATGLDINIEATLEDLSGFDPDDDVESSNDEESN